MLYVFLEFLDKWMDEGRIPREELRIRWWIAGLGGLGALSLAVALLIASVN